MRIPGIAIALLLLTGGCVAVSDSNLYWGEYSSTLYKVKNTPGADSHTVHEKELRSIVEKSHELDLRVPPGVYVELGMYALERDEQTDARKYFELERSTYPESGMLIERVLDFEPQKGESR